MKKLIIPILLLLTVNLFGQSYADPALTFNKQDSSVSTSARLGKQVKKPAKDSIQYRDSFPPIPDNAVFMSAKQIETVYKYIMDNVTASKFNTYAPGLELGFQLLMQLGTADFNAKRKPIKVPLIK